MRAIRLGKFGTFYKCQGKILARAWAFESDDGSVRIDREAKSDDIGEYEAFRDYSIVIIRDGLNSG